MSFIESLKNKPQSVRKLFAFTISAVIAVIVAGFAFFSLFSNISSLGTKEEGNQPAVIIEKESPLQKLKEVFGFAKSEIATSSAEIKEIFKNVNSATSTSADGPETGSTTASTTGNMK